MKGGDYMIINGNGERLYTATETACALGIVVPTLNRWYLFKKENPDNEWAQKIPDYIKLSDNAKAQRYWTESMIWRLRDFAENFPRGRNGVMGSVTQRYQPYELQKQRKKGIKKNGKKKSRSRRTADTRS